MNEFIEYFSETLDVVGVLYFSSSYGFFKTGGTVETFLLLDTDIGQFTSTIPRTKQSLDFILGIAR